MSRPLGIRRFSANGRQETDPILDTRLAVPGALVGYTVEVDLTITIVGVDTSLTTSGSWSVVLPAPQTVPDGREIIVKDEGAKAGTYNIVVTAVSGTVETPSTINTNGGHLRWYSNGTNKWYAC